jgi:wyosine [tRNA(Phe)-imidazoG37] synthetase (radical SAM superfamily)
MQPFFSQRDTIFLLGLAFVKKKTSMVREETVFGPIYSRRLGSSLGINLLPERGKFCNFDCIYCECGWNIDGRTDRVLPTAAKVRTDLERMLMRLSGQSAAAGHALDSQTSHTNHPRMQELSKENTSQPTPIDSITFSGDGEPTLNPDFAQIIDDTLRLRDLYYPSAKVSVLSNATRAHIPEVFEALRRVDNPIMKIDAPTNALAAIINKPAPGYDVQRVVEALKGFHGDFVLQTCMLRGNGFDSSSPEVLLPLMDFVRLLRPREWMVYTIDRPTPMQGLQKFSPEEMKALVRPIIDEHITKVQIKGAVEDC